MPLWNATPPDKANIWSFIMLLIDLDPKKGLLNGTKLVLTN